MFPLSCAQVNVAQKEFYAHTDFKKLEGTVTLTVLRQINMSTAKQKSLTSLDTSPSCDPWGRFATAACDSEDTEPAFPRSPSRRPNCERTGTCWCRSGTADTTRSHPLCEHQPEDETGSWHTSSGHWHTETAQQPFPKLTKTLKTVNSIHGYCFYYWSD